jgi:hypothetical protein
MLGYIQHHDFKTWREKINGWIDDLSKSGKPHGFWDAAEKLEIVAETAATARCRSRHT